MRFITTVDTRGVLIQPDEATWQLGLRATSIGCKGALVALREVEPNAEGNRVELRRDGVNEWYVNGPLGVEQGFVLDAVPLRERATWLKAATVLWAIAPPMRRSLRVRNAVPLRERAMQPKAATVPWAIAPPM